MDLYCTRPGCPRPVNPFTDLDDLATLKAVGQKYCTSCGMPLILVGRYVPLKLLGQGGFGAAFLARDRYTPAMRRCVVKQFQPSNTLSPKQLQIAQELFEREAQALEELGNVHPQIPDLFAFFELTVPVGQAGKPDKFFYLAQEFIDGQTMEEELGRRGPLPAQAVMEILGETLEILQFVHENGSIHRDIKLSNIMRHRNGSIFLLDFGAVRQATKAGTKSTGIYSEGYAPPEQMAGGEVYPSSDLYALAVTCIMLLTGKQPNELFESYSNVWRWRNHAPQVGSPLADVLDRMLLSTPSQRYQSAIAVLEALNIRPMGFTPQQTSGRSPTPPPSANPTPSQLPRPAQPLTVQPPPTPSTSLQPSQPAAPQPAQPAQPPAKPARQRSAIAPFSTLELLAGAGFTGFEAGLLAIALVSVLGTTFVSAGFWLVLLVGLILAQSRRIIERVDLGIIAGLTLALVLFIAPLRQMMVIPVAGNLLLSVVVIAVIGGLSAIAFTALFRLIYKLLSSLF